MADDYGEDIGPDDLEMDSDIGAENNIASMPPGYSKFQVYGSDRSIWLPRHNEEPVDYSPPLDLSALLPRTDSTADTLNRSVRSSMYDVSNRLQSFNSKWPANSPVRPGDLARNGFYYVGPIDRVKCIFCNGVVRNWESGDVVEDEHKRHFPSCSFVYSLTQPRDNQTVVDNPAGINLNRCNDNSSLSHGIVPQDYKHPQYATVASRLSTFKSWTQIHPKPEDLARAGLFYLGQSDRVCCFSCNVILHSWEPEDLPMSEHARLFPNCRFVQMNRESADININRGSRPGNIQALLDCGFSEAAISQAVERLKLSGANEDRSSTQQEIRRNILESEAISEEHENKQKSAKELMEENRQLKERKVCKVCSKRDVSTIFLPCGHLVCCDICADTVRVCTVCNTDVRGTIKAFMS